MQQLNLTQVQEVSGGQYQFGLVDITCLWAGYNNLNLTNTLLFAACAVGIQGPSLFAEVQIPTIAKIAASAAAGVVGGAFHYALASYAASYVESK